MHSKSDNIEIMISDETDELLKKLFDSLKNRYQKKSKSMRGSEFFLDYLQLLYYKCHKINLNRGGSYIYSHIFSWLDKKPKSNNKSHE